MVATENNQVECINILKILAFYAVLTFYEWQKVGQAVTDQKFYKQAKSISKLYNTNFTISEMNSMSALTTFDSEFGDSTSKSPILKISPESNIIKRPKNKQRVKVINRHRFKTRKKSEKWYTTEIINDVLLY